MTFFNFSLNRMLAVAERDLRRFRNNRAFMVPMVLMPIVYLVILGKAMGGDLHDLPVAVVDEDHGPASVAIHDRLLTLQQSRQLFRLASEPDPSTAMARLRQGMYKAVVIIPDHFSVQLARGEAAPLGVIVDNTDNTAANVIEGELRRAMAGAAAIPGVSMAAASIDVHMSMRSLTKRRSSRWGAVRARRPISVAENRITA